MDKRNEVVVTELPQKMTGRPYLLGDILDEHVRKYLHFLRDKGAVISTDIVMSCAQGIIKNEDARLLASNSGPIVLTKSWGKSLLQRMGFVKRRASTSAKVSLPHFESLKTQFLLDVMVNVQMDEIPNELIINWDQTAINYIPSGSWTMAKSGSQRVEIVANDDKRQITAAVFAGTLTGDFLPPQLIYQGTTNRCLPKVSFPGDWNVTCTANHWSNEETMKLYLTEILILYVTRKRNELKLAENHRALVIFDQFKGQVTASIFTLLEENNITIVLVPENCTDRLQPLVNKPAKSFLRSKFQDWYADKVCQQLVNQEESTVDLRLSVVKPLAAKWMIQFFDYIKTKPEIVINGFSGAGIVSMLHTFSFCSNNLQ